MLNRLRVQELVFEKKDSVGEATSKSQEPLFHESTFIPPFEASDSLGIRFGVS